MEASAATIRLLTSHSSCYRKGNIILTTIQQLVCFLFNIVLSIHILTNIIINYLGVRHTIRTFAR